MSRTIKDDFSNMEQLAIVERYEQYINYMYPIAQNIPRKHARVRDIYLDAMLGQVELFILAGKSDQLSKLYAADSGLAWLRFWLRFMSDSTRRIITPKQHRVGSIHLAETGSMLGAWIIRKRKG